MHAPTKAKAAPRPLATRTHATPGRTRLHGGLDRDVADRRGGAIELHVSARVLAACFAGR